MWWTRRAVARDNLYSRVCSAADFAIFGERGTRSYEGKSGDCNSISVEFALFGGWVRIMDMIPINSLLPAHPAMTWQICALAVCVCVSEREIHEQHTTSPAYYDLTILCSGNVCVYVRAHIHVCARACVCQCILCTWSQPSLLHVQLNNCVLWWPVFMCVYVCVRMCVFVCMCVFVYVWVCVCMFVGSCIATKLFIGNLPAVGRGES